MNATGGFTVRGFTPAEALDAIEIRGVLERQGTRAENLAREHAFVGRHVLELALSDSAALRRVPGASLISVPSTGIAGGWTVSEGA